MRAQADPAQTGWDREFAFTSSDFDQARRVIYQRAGISLSDGKYQMVYSRLARRLRQTGIPSFRQYLEILDSDPGHPEWEEFTNALTTNLTAFFREEHHFDVLRQFMAGRPAGSETLAIWCCAASTGEEPYSIAMTVAEHFGGLKAPVRILASDIDTRVLDAARQGVYSMEKVSRLDRDRLSHFFLRGRGEREGWVCVRPQLRELISFRQINLLQESWPLRGPLDVIFCRNVMIYFDKQTQRKLLERFARLLKPRGLLFAGHSESFHHATDLFRLKGKTVYERQ